MKVVPEKTINFSDKIGFAFFSDKQCQYVIDGSEGNTFILNSNFEIAHQFKVSYGKNGFSAIHPTDPFVAIAGDDGMLHICQLDGRGLWNKKGNYIAACWSWDGSMLYTLTRVNANALKLIVYNNAGGEVAQHDFADELYESQALLTTIPNRQEMCLQLIAGQDGCETVFLALAGCGITMKPLHKHYSYTCISFNKDGSRFLCIDNDDSTIHHFTYPELHETGSWKADPENGNLYYTLIHLEDKAIINDGDNFYVLDLATMAVVDTVTIAGHEPQPVSAIYENLKEDTLICDIDFLCGAGQHILGYTNSKNKHNFVILNKSSF